MENKFTKKSYLTSFTGFAPVWDAEIGCYNINGTNLLFIPTNSLTNIKVRTNKETKEKIVIFELTYFNDKTTIYGNAKQFTKVFQPKDFIVTEGGIAVRDNDYMRNKLQETTFMKVATLKFDKTGYQFMWDMEKEEKAKSMLENSKPTVLVGGNN